MPEDQYRKEGQERQDKKCSTEFYLQLFLLTLEFERGGGEAGGREVGVGGGAGEHGAVLPPRHRPVAQHGPDQASLLHSVLGTG